MAPELDGWESPERSIWPAIYPELLRQVREHNSTIVFVNNRRAAERVALRLNELAASEDGDERERDGGGSPLGPRTARPRTARPRAARSSGEARSRSPAPTTARSPVRSARRSRSCSRQGRLPCLVATSSLELGIDMGAVDLVLQIESPKSVARGLQRIGRAGHGVGELSVGRIFPKFRGDLLESAVVARRMREGLIEPTVVPRNALDVLAQQIVAIAVAAESSAAVRSRAEGEGAGDGDGGGEQEGAVSVDELHELVRRTHSYSELSRELLENVLDMLDGRYPSQEFGELRARIVWDRLAGTIRARRGARQLAVANAGTIPDRGLYAVTLPDGRRVGELDEEMVYEARAGQTFLLGASSWRIEEIGRDRVVVTPAPGVPGAVPFWKGDSVGREKELGAAIGAFSRWAVDQDEETLQREYDLDERAARNLLEYLARAAAGHARTAERSHDRARALPRRDRRLAAVRAVSLRRPRALGLGAGAVGADARALRRGGRRDRRRRRDRAAPARPRRRRHRVAAVGRRAAAAGPRGGRAGGHRRDRAARPCSGPASARTPPGRC